MPEITFSNRLVINVFGRKMEQVNKTFTLMNATINHSRPSISEYFKTLKTLKRSSSKKKNNKVETYCPPVNVCITYKANSTKILAIKKHQLPKKCIAIRYRTGTQITKVFHRKGYQISIRVRKRD